MYAGHIGFGLGAYSFRKTVPLWLLLIAAQIPDWLDAGACVADINPGPYEIHTHGLAAVGAAAVICALFAYAVTRDVAAALIVAVVVVSHWGLDLFTGVKPTWPGGPVLGLQLYSRPLIDVALETATILAGWLLYRRTLPERVRGSGWTYATLFSLCALQILAGGALALSLGRNAKC